jgi:hypothetical protein
MALYALIRNAEGDEEFDFDDFVDEVFEDTDFLFLFNEDLNGIQHTPAQNTLHTANLDFDDWFLPFREGLQVHPYAVGEDTQRGFGKDRPSGDTRLN